MIQMLVHQRRPLFRSHLPQRMYGGFFVASLRPAPRKNRSTSVDKPRAFLSPIRRSFRHHPGLFAVGEFLAIGFPHPSSTCDFTSGPRIRPKKTSATRPLSPHGPLHRRRTVRHRLRSIHLAPLPLARSAPAARFAPFTSLAVTASNRFFMDDALPPPTRW